MWTSTFIFASFYCLLFLFGLTNVPVLVIVATYKHMRTVTNTLIFNLCLADLIFISFLPIVIAFQMYRDWQFGLVTCKLFYIAESTAKYASVYFVSVLSLDRYLAICHPQWCKRYRNTKLAIIISIFGWIVTATMMIPIYLYSTIVGPDGGRICTVVWPSSIYMLSPVATFEENEIEFGQMSMANTSNSTIYNKRLIQLNETSFSQNNSMIRDYMDSMDNPTAEFYFVVFTFIFCFGIPAVAILYFYIKVVDQLMQASNRAERLKRRYEKTYKKVTRMVLAVITGYIVCWMPYWIQFLTVTFITNIRLSDTLKIIFNCIHLLPYIHSAVNPILYSLMTENFKNIFAELCPGIICCHIDPNANRRSSVNSVRRENTWRKVTSTGSMSTRHRTSTTADLECIRNGVELAALIGQRTAIGQRIRNISGMTTLHEMSERGQFSRPKMMMHRRSISQPIEVGLFDVDEKRAEEKSDQEYTDRLTETTLFIV